MSARPWLTTRKDRMSALYRSVHQELAAQVGGFYVISYGGAQQEPAKVERHRAKSNQFKQQGEIANG